MDIHAQSDGRHYQVHAVETGWHVAAVLAYSVMRQRVPSSPPKTAYLFLDTEWADSNGNDLVSLALISDDGEHTFYAERKVLSDSPTTFVKEVVYPLLDRGPAALTDEALSGQLRAFLGRLPDSFVLFDHENDGRLLILALSAPAADSSHELSAIKSRMTKVIREGAFSEYFEEYFATNHWARMHRHHALVDARALRAAWLRVTGRVDLNSCD